MHNGSGIRLITVARESNVNAAERGTGMRTDMSGGGEFVWGNHCLHEEVMSMFKMRDVHAGVRLCAARFGQLPPAYQWAQTQSDARDDDACRALDC